MLEKNQVGNIVISVTKLSTFWTCHCQQSKTPQTAFNVLQYDAAILQWTALKFREIIE